MVPFIAKSTKKTATEEGHIHEQVTAEDMKRHCGAPRSSGIEKVLERKQAYNTAIENSIASRVAKRVSRPKFPLML